MPRLLRSDTPFKDESFFGYLLRLTELNQYRNISWLLCSADLPTAGSHLKPSVLFSNLDFKNLSTLTKCSIEVLKAKTHTPLENGNFNFFGHPINKVAIHSLYPKICPSCIAETGYYKSVWDFALTTCCHIHKRLLINRCPACKKKLSWFRGEISTCNCGYDFRKSPVEHVIAEELLISEFVSNKMSSDDFRMNTNNPIYELSLGDLFTLISGFSKNIETSETAKNNPIYRLKNFNIREAHNRIISAKNIFDNWPINFYYFLENTKFKSINRKHLHGLCRKFGRFYDTMNRFSLKFSFIKEKFDVYLKEKFSDGHIYRWKSRNFTQESLKHMSQAEAALYLGTTERRIGILLNGGLIKGKKIKVKSRHLIMIERDSVQKFKETKGYIDLVRANKAARRRQRGILTEDSDANFLSLRQIGECLSISLEKAVALKNAGYIFPIEGLTNAYIKAQADELLKKIDSKVKTLEKNDEEMLDFFETSYKLAFLGYKIGDVIAAILSGDLVPVQKNQQIGLKAYQFRKSQVIAYKKDQLERKSACNITVQKYASTIPVNVDSLRFLAKNGFLKSCHSGIWHIGEVLTSEAIVDFESKYIFLSQIAKQHKTSNIFLLQYLEKIAINPISGPMIDNGVTYLFLRKDVSGIDFSRVQRKTKRRGKSPNTQLAK